MENSSIFAIFELKHEKSDPENNPKWARTRLCKKWNQKEIKYFKQVLDHHQRAINVVKEKENILEEHKNRLKEFKEEYEDYEEGEIVEENIGQKLIEDVKSKIEIREENILKIKDHIVFLESNIYCLLTDQLSNPSEK
jgi:uncharacterized protein (DUF305 family)